MPRVEIKEVGVQLAKKVHSLVFYSNYYYECKLHFTFTRFLQKSTVDTKVT